MNAKSIMMIASSAAFILATSCTGYDEEAGAVQGLVPISLTAAVVGEPAGTRAVGNDVEGGLLSQHAMFYAFFQTGVTIARSTSACGTVFTNNVSSTHPDSYPYFNDDASETVVKAYYPYLRDGKQVKNTTTTFSVETDQSTSDGYHASDLMYATATIQKTNPTAQLAFSHQLSRIIVKLKAGGITNVPVTVTLNSTKTTTTITDGQQAATPVLSNTAPIALGTVKVTSADSCLSAIIIPQSLEAGTTFLTFNVEGIESYTYEIPDGGLTFAPGASYTFSILLSTGKITFQSASITNWYGEGVGEEEGHVIDETSNPLTI